MITKRRELERRVTTQIVRLARVYRREVDRALQGYGISDAQAVPVLHIARCGGGIRQHLLAEEIGIEGPSLVRLLDQLCGNGLVERRDDWHDRRAKTLHLTAAGEVLAARVEEVLTRLRETLLAPVGDADVAATARVLDVLDAGLAELGNAAKGER